MSTKAVTALYVLAVAIVIGALLLALNVINAGPANRKAKDADVCLPAPAADAFAGCLKDWYNGLAPQGQRIDSAVCQELSRDAEGTSYACRVTAQGQAQVVELRLHKPTFGGLVQAVQEPKK